MVDDSGHHEATVTLPKARTIPSQFSMFSRVIASRRTLVVMVASSCCFSRSQRTMSRKEGGGYSGKVRYGSIRRTTTHQERIAFALHVIEGSRGWTRLDIGSGGDIEDQRERRSLACGRLEWRVFNFHDHVPAG